MIGGPMAAPAARESRAELLDRAEAWRGARLADARALSRPVPTAGTTSDRGDR